MLRRVTNFTGDWLMIAAVASLSGRLAEVRADLVWLLAIDFGLGPSRRRPRLIRLAEQSVVEDPAQSRPHEMLAAARYRAATSRCRRQHEQIIGARAERKCAISSGWPWPMGGSVTRNGAARTRSGCGWVEANASRDQQLADSGPRRRPYWA